MSRLSPSTKAAPGCERDVQRLLEIVRRTVSELRPQAATALQPGLDSVLDRDLGLDSLARAELWARIEQEFGVRLPDSLFANAETPADLLRALQGRAAPAAISNAVSHT